MSKNDQTAPHGTGAYNYTGSAFGVSLVNIPQTELDAFKDAHRLSGATAQELDDKSFNYFGLLGSLGLGYTYKLDNNMIVGGEVEVGFPVIKPKFILGYMVSSNDQLSVNVGYNFLPRILMSKKATKNLSAFSGIGVDIAYQHFFTNGTFMRFSLINEFYFDAPNALTSEMLQRSQNTISYKSTIYDVKIGFSYGMQW